MIASARRSGQPRFTTQVASCRPTVQLPPPRPVTWMCRNVPGPGDRCRSAQGTAGRNVSTAGQVSRSLCTTCATTSCTRQPGQTVGRCQPPGSRFQSRAVNSARSAGNSGRVSSGGPARLWSMSGSRPHAALGRWQGPRLAARAEPRVRRPGQQPGRDGGPAALAQAVPAASQPAKRLVGVGQRPPCRDRTA